MNNLRFLITVFFCTTLYFSSTSAHEPIALPRDCPTDNPYHILVNKQQGIDMDFVPQNLVIPDVPFSFSDYHQKKYMESTAATALESLFDAATADGITLAAVSGYRSYDRQEAIYNNYVSRDGQAKADTYSARPGMSEHQTGLAMDVSSAAVNYSLTAAFGDTEEGKWLKENAHLHGFIIRYPEGKQHITGYIYEPWHLRYTGIALAEEVYQSSLTLEELDTCCPSLTDEVPHESEPTLHIPDSDTIQDNITSDNTIHFSVYTALSNKLHVQWTFTLTT